MRYLKFTITICLSMFMFSLSAKQVPYETAVQVAKNFYYERTGISQMHLQLVPYENYSKQIDSHFYIFNIKDNQGFVIVSAEDTYHPVIGYAFEGEFVFGSHYSNINFLMEQFKSQIDYLRTSQAKQETEIAKAWEKYTSNFTNFSPSKFDVVVDPLTADILWDQGEGWNDLCPEDGAGPGGHVYAGCVATAMGIVMKYWEHPINGEGQKSYYTYDYGTLTANFGESTYFWNLMPGNEPNIYSAQVLYHLGVSVSMGYSPDGSGAYSFDVPDAMKNYFGYATSTTYVSRSSYTTAQWISMLKDNLDASHPVYYSGNDGDGGHAFICDGYDTDDYFHFNFGWSGSSNGFYTVDDVNGYHLGNAAVKDIVPDNQSAMSPAPENFQGEVDVDVQDFTVNLTWEAPQGVSVSNYKIFRDAEEVTILPGYDTDYSDMPEVGNYEYAVQALYTDSNPSWGVGTQVNGLFNTRFYAKDPDTGGDVFMATVSFNGEQITTGLAGALFVDVPFGMQQMYVIEHSDYPTTSGYIDVTENLVLNIPLDGSTANGSEELDENMFKLFPNPATDILNLSYAPEFDQANIEIFDITGRLIYADGISQQINIEDFKPGYYVLKVSSETHTYQMKIIIN